MPEGGFDWMRRLQRLDAALRNAKLDDDAILEEFRQLGDTFYPALHSVAAEHFQTRRRVLGRVLCDATLRDKVRATVGLALALDVDAEERAALYALLMGGAGWARYLACEALNLHPAPDDVPHLIRALADATVCWDMDVSFPLAHEAARGLHRRNDPRACRALMAWCDERRAELTHANEHIRWAAIRILAELRDQEGLRFLRETKPAGPYATEMLDLLDKIQDASETPERVA